MGTQVINGQEKEEDPEKRVGEKKFLCTLTQSQFDCVFQA